MYIVGDWFTGGVQSVDTQSLIDSVIITNKSIIRRIRVPTYEMYKTHWRNGEISLGRIQINNFQYYCVFTRIYKIFFLFCNFITVSC